MPQTQKLTQNSNKLKLVSQLGSALGWGKSAAGRTSTEKAPKAGIYAMAAVHGTPGGKAASNCWKSASTTSHLNIATKKTPRRLRSKSCV